MGLIGRFSKSILQDSIRECVSEIYENYTKQSPLILPPGIDSVPLQDDVTYITEERGNGQSYCLGVYPNASAEEGEIKIYSRANGSTLKAQVYLKKDGTIEIKNDLGSIIIDSAGLVEIKSSALTLLQALTTTLNAIKTGVIDPSTYAFNAGAVTAIEAGIQQLNQVLK